MDAGVERIFVGNYNKNRHACVLHCSQDVEGVSRLRLEYILEVEQRDCLINRVQMKERKKSRVLSAWVTGEMVMEFCFGPVEFEILVNTEVNTINSQLEV